MVAYKPFLTIKRTKEGIAIAHQHDYLVVANGYRYQRNISEPESGHVYETWTKEEWDEATERKIDHVSE